MCGGDGEKRVLKGCLRTQLIGLRMPLTLRVLPIVVVTWIVLALASRYPLLADVAPLKPTGTSTASRAMG